MNQIIKNLLLSPLIFMVTNTISMQLTASNPGYVETVTYPADSRIFTASQTFYRPPQPEPLNIHLLQNGLAHLFTTPSGTSPLQSKSPEEFETDMARLVDEEPSAQGPSLLTPPPPIPLHPNPQQAPTQSAATLLEMFLQQLSRACMSFKENPIMHIWTITQKCMAKNNTAFMNARPRSAHDNLNQEILEFYSTYIAVGEHKESRSRIFIATLESKLKELRRARELTHETENKYALELYLYTFLFVQHERLMRASLF